MNNNFQGDMGCYEGSILATALNEMQNQKNCCPRYAIGATGPTGPTGPAGTIVEPVITATATTLPAGDDATATVTGTYPNLTLELGIPQGPTGPSIETPTFGATATVLDPGAEPTATITGEYPDLTLELGIPQGPTGPANGLNAFGGLYSNTQQQATVDQDAPVTVTLDNPMIGSSNVNVTSADENSIGITEEGTYEITYNVVAEAGTQGTITVAAMNGGNDIVGSAKTVNLPASNAPVSISSSVISILSAGDAISLQLSSTAQVTGNINSANLIVKKLN